mmetsp:Transcript_4847/g.10880  ORF Transcript_4847/g.10880 Transcript_4847/m.10880 type:complete len:252 (-) Transcript_4847:1155-1910(-)
MAIKSMIKMRADPACPSRWSATAGGTSPEPASPELIGSMRAVEASPSEVAKEKGIANLECRRANDSPKQVPPSSTGRAGGDSTLPIRLVDEDGTEVSNNVDNSEHESTAGNHREIRPLDVSCNGAASHLFLAAVIHEEGSLGSSIRRVDGLALLGCVANGLVEEIVHLVSRVNLDVDDSDHGDEDSEDDHRVQVRGHERGFQPSSRSVKDDSPGNQEGRELVVYSCQSLHSCGAAQKKHGRHDDVGAEPEE